MLQLKTQKCMIKLKIVIFNKQIIYQPYKTFQIFKPAKCQFNHRYESILWSRVRMKVSKISTHGEVKNTHSSAK